MVIKYSNIFAFVLLISGSVVVAMEEDKSFKNKLAKLREKVNLGSSSVLMTESQNFGTKSQVVDENFTEIAEDEEHDGGGENQRDRRPIVNIINTTERDISELVNDDTFETQTHQEQKEEDSNSEPEIIQRSTHLNSGNGPNLDQTESKILADSYVKRTINGIENSKLIRFVKNGFKYPEAETPDTKKVSSKRPLFFGIGGIGVLALLATGAVIVAKSSDELDTAQQVIKDLQEILADADGTISQELIEQVEELLEATTLLDNERILSLLENGNVDELAAYLSSSECAQEMLDAFEASIESKNILQKSAWQFKKFLRSAVLRLK